MCGLGCDLDPPFHLRCRQRSRQHHVHRERIVRRRHVHGELQWTDIEDLNYFKISRRRVLPTAFFSSSFITSSHLSESPPLRQDARQDHDVETTGVIVLNRTLTRVRRRIDGSFDPQYVLLFSPPAPPRRGTVRQSRCAL